MKKVNENIRNRLNNIFQDVFDDEKIDIFEEMTAEDIDEWDSLMHVTLVLAVEKEFDIRLNASEIGKLQNVGTMLILLEKHVVKG